MKRLNTGFTLAEIMIVIAITAVVGTILVAIFANTLRGSNKSQIISAMKQNGQAVMDNMEKAVRNADSVVCPIIIPPSTSAQSNILVVGKDNVYTRFKFVPMSGSSNGLIQQDTKVPAVGDKINVFRANVCTDPWTVGNYNTLTDTSSQSGVSVVAGSLFTRYQSAGFKDSVNIKFILKPGVQAPVVITGQIDPMTFQTTVHLR